MLTKKEKDACSSRTMTNLDNTLKNRDLTLPTKVHISKAIVFSVVAYRYENWTKKKAAHWRTDAFPQWCWRILLRVPWTARRSNRSIVKEISPDYSLEGLILKLKLQYFGHPTWNTNSLDSEAEKDWRQEKEAMTKDEMIGWHHRLESERVLGVGDEQGSLACWTPWGHKELDTTEGLNWTELQYASLENSMDRGAWWTILHGSLSCWCVAACQASF